MIEEVIINLIIAVIVYVGTFFALKWMAKTADTLIEKYIIVFLGVLIYICVTVFLLDYYNIPTSFGYTFRVDAKTWLNCIFCVIGSLAGGFLAMIVARMQIEKSEESNRERDKEENRLKYMPLIKYEIIDEKEFKENIQEEINIIDNNDNPFFDFVILLTNIGLAPIRSIKLELSGDGISKYNINFETSLAMAVNDKYAFLVSTNVPSEDYNWNLEVTYEDILTNIYKQNINILVSALNRYNNSKREYICKHTVQKEELVKTKK